MAMAAWVTVPSRAHALEARRTNRETAVMLLSLWWCHNRMSRFMGPIGVEPTEKLGARPGLRRQIMSRGMHVGRLPTTRMLNAKRNCQAAPRFCYHCVTTEWCGQRVRSGQFVNGATELIPKDLLY